MWIFSGTGSSTSSGDITLLTVNAGTVGVSGALAFCSGTTSSGTSGSFTVLTGAATGGKGGDATSTHGGGGGGRKAKAAKKKKGRHAVLSAATDDDEAREDTRTEHRVPPCPVGYMDPKEFHDAVVCKDTDTIVLDVRNWYESRVGEFILIVYSYGQLD